MQTTPLRSLALIVAANAMLLTNAIADVVVVTGAKSSITTLSTLQASQLFLGKVTSVGGTQASPIDQTPGTSVRDEFYTKVANKTPAQLASIRSNLIFSGKGQPPLALASSAEVKRHLADNPNTIGYIEASAVDPGVKVLLAP